MGGWHATFSNSSAAEADGPPWLQIVRRSDVARQYRPLIRQTTISAPLNARGARKRPSRSSNTNKSPAPNRPVAPTSRTCGSCALPLCVDMTAIIFARDRVVFSYRRCRAQRPVKIFECPLVSAVGRCLVREIRLLCFRFRTPLPSVYA